MVRGTGIQFWWHDNGQSMTEIWTVDGRFTGRNRMWLRDSTLIEEQFYLENCRVTRDEYFAAVSDNPCYPQYEGEPAGNVAPQGLELECKQHSLFVESILTRSEGAEARRWLSEARSTEPHSASLGDIPTAGQALALIDNLYRAGAVEVIATPIYSGPRGKEFVDSLIVRLPTDQSQRRAVREFCRDYCQRSGAALLPG